MSGLAARLEKIPEFLAERAARYQVPGASLAVLADGEVFECATGVINQQTQVETTTDSVFQIGSITKIWTTSLIMQLVDEGRVELDAPVRTYLPELQLGNGEAARQITVRHLLTHTSGIDGDFFQDAGRGDDCIERYVLACSALGQLHPPGEGFSYCNAGFVLAGRIIEKLRGTPWDLALQRWLAKPIEATSLETYPERALYYRAAVGHVPDGEGGFRVAPEPFLARSNGPAGATPFSAARDLLQLAKLHLAGGVSERGVRLLSEASVAAMQEPQVKVPDGSADRHWGLGWMLFEWSGQRVIGHDGGTIGHSAFLRIVPERNVVVALLTNGGNTAAFYRRVFGAVLDPLAGIALPPLPEPQDVPVDPARYVGSYERLTARLEVSAREGRLFLQSTDRRPLEGYPEPPEVELLPMTETMFCWTPPQSRFRSYVTFNEFDEDGRALRIDSGTRTFPRVGR